MIFKLTQLPRSTGGVKYETSVPGEPKPWAVYVPQSVLAKQFGGVPEELSIELEEVEK